MDTTPGQRLAQYLLGELDEEEPMGEYEARMWELVLVGSQGHSEARYRHEDDMRELEAAAREESDDAQHEGMDTDGF